MTNQDIAKMLEKLAFFLALRNENEFKIRAYLNAAISIKAHTVPLEEMLLGGVALTEIAGVGNVISKKIEDIIIFREVKTLKEIYREFPESLYELSAIKGIGPRTIAKVFQDHGICTLNELGEFIKKGGKLDISSGFEKRIRDHFS